MKKLYAVAHGETASYLTAGKKYKVLDLLPSREWCGHGFYITDDERDAIFCNEINCGHILGGDWELAYE